MAEIRVVILCGGIGSRLWPLSTPEKPKPFHCFGSALSLFQQTLLRVAQTPFASPAHVVTEQCHAELARAQAEAVGVAVQVVLEPSRRDTCAAALAGILAVAGQEPEATIAVLAADHMISDVKTFGASMVAAMAVAGQQRIVVFGVPPRGPNPEFGYIMPAVHTDDDGARMVDTFIEKPSVERAAALMAKGALWNSGSFLATADVWLAEAKRHVPEVLTAVAAALTSADRSSLGLISLSPRFADAPTLSLDHGMIEKSKRLAVLPVTYDWSDVGTWDEVARLSGNPSAFIMAKDLQIIAPGFDDLIVVAHGHKLLLTRRGQSHALKQAVSALNPPTGLTKP